MNVQYFNAIEMNEQLGSSFTSFNIYSSKLTKNKSKDEFWETFKHNIPKLNETEKQLCEDMLSIEECGEAQKQLPNNKS